MLNNTFPSANFFSHFKLKQICTKVLHPKPEAGENLKNAISLNIT